MARKRPPALRRGDNANHYVADDLGIWADGLDGWSLHLWCNPDEEGRYVVYEARLRMNRPPLTPAPRGGIGVDIWRGVPIGRLAAEAIAATIQEGAEIMAQLDEEDREQRLIELLPPPDKEGCKRRSAAWVRRHGPAGHPNYLYAVLAGDYLAEWQRGNRKATETVASWYSMPRATAARRLRRARSLGLLVSAGQGRAGGELSEEAEAHLATPEAQRLIKGE